MVYMAQDVVHMIVTQFMQPEWLPSVLARVADASPLLFEVRKRKGEYAKELRSCIILGQAERAAWILEKGAAVLTPGDVVEAACHTSSVLFWDQHVSHPVPSVCMLRAVKTGNLRWTRKVARDVPRDDPIFCTALLDALRRRALDIASWIKNVMTCPWPHVEQCVAATRWADAVSKYSSVRWIYLNHPLCQINTVP
jgi:hypothetical protein